MAYPVRLFLPLAIAGWPAVAEAQAAEGPRVPEERRSADSLERGESDEKAPAPRVDLIDFYAGHVSETMSGLSGASGTRYVQEIALGARIDLDRVGFAPGMSLGMIGVTIIDRRGRSLTVARIDNLVPVQTVVGPSEGTRLTEASWTIPLAGSLSGSGRRTSIKFGRLFGQADFNGSPRYDGDQLYCNFMSNGICGRPIAVPQNAGFTSYPVSVWAARLRGDVSQRVTLSAGAYEVNPRLRGARNGFDVSTRGATGVFLPVEVTIRTGDAEMRHGQIRLGGYHDTSSVPDAVTMLAPRYLGNVAVPDAIASLPRQRGRYGAYVLTDFRIQRDRAGEPQGTILVANVQWGDSRTATFTWTGFAGVVRRGTLAGRDHDSVAVGASVNRVNHRVADHLNRAGIAGPCSEMVAEASYGVSIADGVGMRLGLQYILDPLGLSERRDVLVAGVRTGIDL